MFEKGIEKIVKWYLFSKITPSLFLDKASCTRQFESKLSLHSLASLFPIKEGDFSKTYPSLLTLKEGSSKIIPSFFTIKEGSTFLSKPLFNSLYAPFGSPSSGGQKPFSKREGCNRPPVLRTASLYGWRTKAVCARLCGMGPPGERGRLKNIIILCLFA